MCNTTNSKKKKKTKTISFIDTLRRNWTTDRNRKKKKGGTAVDGKLRRTNYLKKIFSILELLSNSVHSKKEGEE